MIQDYRSYSKPLRTTLGNLQRKVNILIENVQKLEYKCGARKAQNLADTKVIKILTASLEQIKVQQDQQESSKIAAQALEDIKNVKILYPEED